MSGTVLALKDELAGRVRLSVGHVGCEPLRIIRVKPGAFWDWVLHLDANLSLCADTENRAQFIQWCLANGVEVTG